ncbi:LacI family DNA-binding transcriptional regulator [Fictibacillus terranigra]|uniref:LacI family DNA-binding transcriptional regulator n=1 Tax=Fictibacillus terranigra TaxID=3058424 RepID=A0ABT8E3F0_9BACL|nr:LacI family DNA-binding transcriptional regulator [Fictibacillus sp. CENA-BCM004]MDN4072434.1 LacI family DNA-binding transcriptional regulator [Fictibacillus sp. CENA-BCM004]
MATIKDIAKHAGVSVTTVSRALNGYSDVNEKTRDKIKAVAKELNYSPNLLARSLVMKKTKTIGLLVSGMQIEGSKDNFTYEVLCGINDCAGERGYDLILFSTNTELQQEKTYNQLCQERKVDGVILQGIKTDDPYLREVVESDIPCVLVDIPIESDSVGYVTTDNKEGAKKAVEHLIGLGHRQIGMINGHKQAFVSQERLEGYRLALEEAKLDFKEENVVDGAFSESEAQVQAAELLKKNPKITAIFCASDLMALGTIKAAAGMGKQVPQALSVAGFDDIILASYSSPTLTTIAQDRYQIGYESAILLIQILEGKAGSRKKVLNTNLIKRESTAKNHEA